MKIKVCGLTQLDQIQDLVEMKINFLGFIFYDKSPRYVLDHLTLNEIKSIKSLSKVGVFVNETLEKIIEISTEANLNFIQLHGDEDLGFILNLKEKVHSDIKIIKVIRIGNQNKIQLDEILKTYEPVADFFLFDTDSQAFGGTGKTFEWQIFNEIEIPKPYFLSGGISPENSDNLKFIINKPFALDINSRFEMKPGIKDLGKINSFLKLVKQSTD